MNPPPKRGKYSMTADLNEMMDIGSGKLKDGWKQCEYVSNRTRLRCKNIRKAEMIKDYGFCEEVCIFLLEFFGFFELLNDLFKQF
jgi:hypothetical protein